MNDNWEIADEWTFTWEKGEQTRIPGGNPQQTVWKLVLEVKIHSLYKIGDKFTWSEHAGSNPLNYWLSSQSKTRLEKSSSFK